MARYYFYIVNNGEVIADLEGDEFPDLPSAKVEAVASARDVARQQIAERRSLKDACIEIRDANGRVLASVDIQEVLDHPVLPGFESQCGSAHRGHNLH